MNETLNSYATRIDTSLINVETITPMSEDARALYQENYENKGICATLPSFLKTFEKEYKKQNKKEEISYFPWAVVERLFRMQGGHYKVMNWAKAVEFTTNELAPDSNGELTLQEVKSVALFIHLRAYWNGAIEDEYYPIYNNQNAKVLKTPDSLDLNAVKQRGLVRLIARISGIGLYIFEQQEAQFEEESKGTTVKVEVVEEEPTPKPAPKKTKAKTPIKEVSTEKVESNKEEKVEKEIVVDVVEETVEENELGFLGQFLSGEETDTVEKSVEVIESNKQLFDEEEFAMDSQEYAEKLLEVRKVIKSSSKQKESKAYVVSLEKELLSELTYSELEGLLSSIS